MTSETEIFRCRQCGQCCEGDTTISLNTADIERLCMRFRLTEKELLQRYLHKTGNIIQMRTVGGKCIFYRKRQGCTIYDIKPWRCSQWPFHPSILKAEANFDAIKESCPGINRTMSYKEFCRKLVELLGD